jgi:hypothetical protein
VSLVVYRPIVVQKSGHSDQKKLAHFVYTHTACGAVGRDNTLWRTPLGKQQNLYKYRLVVVADG